MGWLDCHLDAFLPTDRGNGGGDWEIGIPIDDERLADRETFASWQLPVTKHFAVRSTLKTGIARTFFTVCAGRIVLLH
jgi:hypothetical protein